MTEPTPPAEGLVRREINGVEYWFDEATRKVHSTVFAGKRVMHAFQREVAVPATPVAAPAPAAVPAPPVTAPVAGTPVAAPLAGTPAS